MLVIGFKPSCLGGVLVWKSLSGLFFKELESKSLSLA